MLQKITNLSTTVLVCLLLGAIWWVIPLWMYGVFDDGMFYSCISRNLVYDAQATIWDLKVSNALDNSFNGHPPMAFWLQALFFLGVGDYYWVERVYSFLFAVGGIFLLLRCWATLNNNSSVLAVLLWLTISIVGWSYGNNMLENTMVLFCTTAVLLQIRSAQSQKLSYSFLSVFFIFGATLVKGPVGLFPLATYSIYSLTIQRNLWCKAIVVTAGMSILLGLCYVTLFYTSVRAYAFFERYFDLQLTSSISGMDSLAESRFYLLQALFEELLIAITLVFSSWLIVTKYFKKIITIQWDKFCFWLLLALSASLPMLISPKQLRFYIVPSTLFYVLALATIWQPCFEVLAQRFKVYTKTILIFKTTLLVGIISCLVISFNNKGDYARSLDTLPDAMKLGEIIPAKTEIYLHPDLYKRWNLHAYMYRYFYIDLSTVPKGQKYALYPKTQIAFLPYKKVLNYANGEVFGLESFDLYEQ